MAVELESDGVMMTLSLFRCINAFSIRPHCAAVYGDELAANNVSRIFPRYWWYHDLAVSMGERKREIKLNMGQFPAKTLLI